VEIFLQGSCHTLIEDKNDQEYLLEHHEMFF
jgi:hypothetical protein